MDVPVADGVSVAGGGTKLPRLEVPAAAAHPPVAWGGPAGAASRCAVRAAPGVCQRPAVAAAQAAAERRVVALAVPAWGRCPGSSGAAIVLPRVPRTRAQRGDGPEIVGMSNPEDTCPVIGFPRIVAQWRGHRAPLPIPVRWAVPCIAPDVEPLVAAFPLLCTCALRQRAQRRCGVRSGLVPLHGDPQAGPAQLGCRGFGVASPSTSSSAAMRTRRALARCATIVNGSPSRNGCGPSPRPWPASAAFAGALAELPRLRKAVAAAMADERHAALDALLAGEDALSDGSNSAPSDGPDGRPDGVPVPFSMPERKPKEELVNVH